MAHTGPNTTHTLEKLHEGGEVKEVVEPNGKAIGPQWFAAGGKFFLGADGHLGRDEMVRLIYGGRTSLFIGVVAAIITTVLAVIFGLLAGYLPRLDRHGHLPDHRRDLGLPGRPARRSRWGSSLAVGGLKVGPIDTCKRARSGSRS